MKRSIAIAGLGIVTAGTFAVAPTAHAEERDCRGTIGAVTVDNLRVPSGASCTLRGTRIQGTVKVETGARLDASDIRVIGNVQAEGHRDVRLVSSTVGGSVQLKQGGTANVQRNDINGDLQSFTNRGSQTFNRNTIDGNLQCKENVPAPTGGGNIVGGNKEDQCARL